MSQGSEGPQMSTCWSELLDCAPRVDPCPVTSLPPAPAPGQREQELYDAAFAAAHVRLEDQGWWHQHRYRWVREVLARECPPPGAVLNVGCGTNLLGLSLAREGYRVGALDASRAMLMSRPGHPRMRRLLGCAPCREVRAGAWDALVALDLLEHVREDRELLEWMRERLRPGGLLVLTVPAYQGLLCSYFDSMHHRRYSRGSLLAVLRQAGLEVERTGYLFGAVFPLLVLNRLPYMLKDRWGRPFVPGQDPSPIVRAGSALENAGLGALCRAEYPLARRGRLPWGSTVIAVARRPR